MAQWVARLTFIGQSWFWAPLKVPDVLSKEPSLPSTDWLQERIQVWFTLVKKSKLFITYDTTTNESWGFENWPQVLSSIHQYNLIQKVS